MFCVFDFQKLFTEKRANNSYFETKVPAVATANGWPIVAEASEPTEHEIWISPKL